jgi:Flp pilus assembly pilin Flp
MRLRWSRATRRLFADARAQTTTEYALVLAGLAAILLIGILVFAGHVGALFHRSAPDAPALQAPSAADCDPHYVGACIPSPPPDLDCSDLAAFGITGVVRVVGGDPQGLDPDGDGIACD